jgi:uncharacterized protein
MGEIIFTLVKTRGGFYVYDRHSNAVIRIPESEFSELRRVKSGELASGDSSVIRKYQGFGMFQPNVVERIRHPKSDIAEYHVDRRIHQMILQVTQQCNLRCAYCAYSGIYKGSRVHSSKRMSWDTAKRAIDFFLEHSIDDGDVVIGFYGGEPLLEFDLIKKCVQYVRDNVEGRKVGFTITTNGTLLKGEALDFMVENDISVAISLDGSKEEHDANRRFVNGEGSFDTVIANIDALKQKYPDFFDKVSILTTINPHMDLSCVLEYFTVDDVFADKQIMFNSMNPISHTESMNYDEKYYLVRNFEYVKLLFHLIGRLDRDKISKLMYQSVAVVARLKNGIRTGSVLARETHHGGPCMAGSQRLFVRVDGEFYPCERVNEESDFFNIGNLDTGFNYSKIDAIMNIGRCSADTCKTCWALNQCSMCSSQIEMEGDDGPTAQSKAVECKRIKRNLADDMYELCVLREFGYDANTEMR